MKPRRGPEDRERRSWREIDRMRDSSRHVSREDRQKREPRPLPPEVKKALFEKFDEKLFGEDPKLRKAADKLRDAFGTPQFEPAIQSFQAAFGLPKDWATLSLLLESRRAAVVVSAVEALAARWDQLTPSEQDQFRRKLRLLVMAAADPEVSTTARMTLERIGGTV